MRVGSVTQQQVGGAKRGQRARPSSWYRHTTPRTRSRTPNEVTGATKARKRRGRGPQQHQEKECQQVQIKESGKISVVQWYLVISPLLDLGCGKSSDVWQGDEQDVTQCVGPTYQLVAGREGNEGGRRKGGRFYEAGKVIIGAR